MTNQYSTTIASNKFTTRRLTLMGMLAAISIVLIIFVRIPLMPAAPWLIYDLADIPLLVGAFALGPLMGLLILTVVALIHAFMLSGYGIISFIMNMASSGALIVVASLIFRKLGDTNRSLAISLTIGGLAMTAIMIPLNLIFTPLLFGIPVAAVAELILPVLLPFNLLKAAANGGIFFLLYKGLRAVLPN